MTWEWLGLGLATWLGLAAAVIGWAGIGLTWHLERRRRAAWQQWRREGQRDVAYRAVVAFELWLRRDGYVVCGWDQGKYVMVTIPDDVIARWVDDPDRPASLALGRF